MYLYHLEYFQEGNGLLGVIWCAPNEQFDCKSYAQKNIF